MIAFRLNDISDLRPNSKQLWHDELAMKDDEELKISHYEDPFFTNADLDQYENASTTRQETWRFESKEERSGMSYSMTHK